MDCSHIPTANFVAGDSTAIGTWGRPVPLQVWEFLILAFSSFVGEILCMSRNLMLQPSEIDVFGWQNLAFIYTIPNLI